MIKLVLGVLVGLLLSAALVSAHDDGQRAPVQVEWQMSADQFVWFDCWPSDGHTQGAVWVYLVMHDGTAPYVCPESTRYELQPPPFRFGWWDERAMGVTR